MRNPRTPTYMAGFGNEFSSEALPGALPTGRNSPQRAPHGLYAEQISGTAFTVPRHESRRSWMYRIRPSAAHPAFQRIDNGALGGPFEGPVPNRLRWDPLPLPAAPGQWDFIAGLFTIGAARNPEAPGGAAIHIYRADESMRRIFFDADGDLVDFLSHDRDQSADGVTYRNLPWSPPVRDYRDFGGVRVAAHGDAVWHEPEGEFVYARFDLDELRVNVGGRAGRSTAPRTAGSLTSMP